ncbi:MAG: undecaprenyl-phosphate glucose phosphotransferase [Dysgonamonadaceae bacterium]|jgi:putative colanic acid biosynthesis UDP-glucose lipid carrier transferase|nr:undecaprenyl-phosphate glucose phosphotransferase [Dysgonamonadaceae bacterium]
MPRDRGGYGFLIKWLIVVCDIILFNVLFLLIGDWCRMQEYGDNHFHFRTIILLLNVCYFLALYFVPISVHKRVIFTDRVIQRALLLVSTQLIMFLTCLFLLSFESDILLRNFVILYYLLLYPAFTVWRVISREVLKWNRKKGKNFKRVIIVGAGKNGMSLFLEMKRELFYGYRIIGFFDDNIALRNILPNYLGMTHEVEKFALENNVDEIYCTLPNSEDEKIVRLLNFSEKHMIRFYIVPEFLRYVKRLLDLENIESVPVMAVRAEPLQSPVNKVIKRSFDIIFSLFFLLCIFPFLYIILGIIIKLSSRGPVFFRQKRTGIYGNEFYCYKFRSMHPNMSAHEKQAAKDDPRITRIGNFLRRSNLDEIPQFYNVLKGDMSIVGPRPHMLKHTELYSNIIDRYMVRHLIKPGITGWAQINGFRGETRVVEEMEARVRFDVWYIENWSLLLDIKIIIVTAINMVRGEKNAY